MREYEINEVAMNPSEFDAAIQQAGPAGVVAGFEFEVLVPQKTINDFNQSNASRKKEIDNNLYNNDFLESTDLSELPLNEFLKIFVPKDPNMVEQIRQAAPDQTAALEKVKELFHKIPTRSRAGYIALSFMKRRYGGDLATMDPLLKQLKFAADMASIIYSAARNGSPNEQLALQMQQVASQALGSGVWYSDLLREAGYSSQQLRQLSSAFDYNEDELRRSLRNIDMEWALKGDNDDGEDFAAAAKVLSPAVSEVMGRNVQVFHSYHQAKKNTTDWYIEPDGSLEPNDGDSSAEVVSPPMPAMEALDALKKFFGLAKQLNLYTNESTGLHINISIPQTVDPLKLAVFLGDEYVAKSFGREENEYVDLVMRKLRLDMPDATNDNGDGVAKTKEIPAKKNPVFNQPGSTFLKFRNKVLQRLAADATGEHTASISDNGEYYSFRHAGGNYLADFNKIYATVGRFIRAMLIASDPAVYRNEYLAKLSKLYMGTTGTTAATPATSMTQVILTQGIPVLTFDVYNDTAYAPSLISLINGARMTTGLDTDEVSVTKLPISTTGKSKLMRSNSELRSRNPSNSRNLANMQANGRIYTLVVTPKTLAALRDMLKITVVNPDSERWAHTSRNGSSYFYVTATRLPAKSADGRKIIQSIMKNIKK
jgi:hypothetical protein